MFTHRIVSVVVLLAGAGFAVADSSPELITVYPPGAKSGDSVEVTVTGSALSGDEKLLFSATGFAAEPTGTATVEPGAEGSGKGKRGAMKGATALKFKVTTGKDVPVGLHDVRVVGKNGLSNPRAFAVGSLREVVEVEPNNDVGQAQRIDLDSTVNGVISTPTDVDYFVFKATAGQGIVVACLTSTIDSKLSADVLVSAPDGKMLASNRSYRGGDAVLDFRAPSDGDYLVRVASFAYSTGGPDHFYRLTATTGPWVDAVFPPIAGQPHAYYGRNLSGGKPDPGFLRPDGKPYDVLKLPASSARGDGLFSRDLVSPTAGGLDGEDDMRLPPGRLMLEPQTSASVVLDNDDNGAPETAQPLTLPCDVAGRIGRKNSRHWYRFDAKKGEVWTMEVFAERIGSPITPYLVITDEKGKSVARVEDAPDPLSNNQFYCKSDDPGRYRFAAPADGQYRVMASSLESAVQWGVRDQFVLRIAPEKPDFRLVVMPMTPHLTDAGTVARNGSVLFSVFVFRRDGFTDPITLKATNLPPGVSCPPQTIGAGQTRGTLVLTASKDAADWAGFITIEGISGELRHAARPFSLTWSAQGIQPNQPPPNSPMLARLDRGPGLALAVRGDAPFTLTTEINELKGRPGEKLELTVKVVRHEKFKDAVQVYSAVPNFGPKQQGNNPIPPIATIPADKTEVKISLDISQNLQAGTYPLVLRGQTTGAAPRTSTIRPAPGFPTVPISVVIEGRRR